MISGYFINFKAPFDLPGKVKRFRLIFKTNGQLQYLAYRKRLITDDFEPRAGVIKKRTGMNAWLPINLHHFILNKHAITGADPLLRTVI